MDMELSLADDTVLDGILYGLEKQKDYELLVTWLFVYCRFHSPTNRDKLGAIHAVLKPQWDVLMGSFQYSLCILNDFCL
jgi:hypothetical protein